MILHILSLSLYNSLHNKTALSHVSAVIIYGFSLFNLKKKEFGDSAFFMQSGVYQASNEAVIFGNKVYTVTNSGLKSHEMNTTFPVYTTWTTEIPGAFKHIDSESDIVFSNDFTISSISVFLRN